MRPKMEKISQLEARKRIVRLFSSFLPFLAGGVYTAYYYIPWDMPSLYYPADRVIYTLQWHVISAAMVFNLFVSVGTERAHHAWNPLDPKNQGNTIVLNRILTNTVEQFCGFTMSTLALSTYLPSEQMKIIPILIVTWALARLLFQYGYMANPIYRAPGMAATWMCSFASLLGVMYFSYQEGRFVPAAFIAALTFKMHWNHLIHGLFKTPIIP